MESIVEAELFSFEDLRRLSLGWNLNANEKIQYLKVMRYYLPL